MVKMSAVYQGDKHCKLSHEPSSSTIETDAPKDNNGKGENFSPTDLLGAALGSCMLTVMAIAAEKDGVSLKGAWTTMEKEMAAHPRRVSKLNVVLHMPRSIPHDYRAKLEEIAKGCPVKVSLHPDISIPILFHYDM